MKKKTEKVSEDIVFLKKYDMTYLEPFQLYILWKLIRLAKEEPKEKEFFLFDFLTYYDHSTFAHLYYTDILRDFYIDDKTYCEGIFSFIKTILRFFDKLTQEKFIKGCKPTTKNNLSELFAELESVNNDDGKNSFLNIPLYELAHSDANAFIIEFSDRGINLAKKCLKSYLNLFIKNKLYKIYMESSGYQKIKFKSYGYSVDFLKNIFGNEYEIHESEWQVLGIQDLIKKKWAESNRQEEIADFNDHAKEDYINKLWSHAPIIRPIETLFAMEQEGKITIDDITLYSITVVLSEDFIAELPRRRKRKQIRYTYDPNENKLIWDGGEFSPRDGVGVIFRELFSRRAIIGEDGEVRKPSKPLSVVDMQKLPGVKYETPDYQIPKVINTLNNKFLENKLPLQIPKAKEGRYHIEQKENGLYELIELELRK